MPLDQVRTQVLLLHSEQSTLDSLSAGFNDDRYTIHCATSGTEALNTLGETPIHVIVSAKDLPGMSGVEALREAKKRSPETIGILLAGNDDDDVEALVGEKEVFQIVRGGINADDLGKLIDNATRQMRLLALAESANDTAANPDEPAAEHIIMETSENGSTIISDGTGRMPALDPQRISAAAVSGSRTVDVLVLTKDEEFLETVKESSRGMHNVRSANTLAQAEETLAKYKVGVAVVDAAMVGPNVEKLTAHLSKKTGRLVHIVAGRRDDGEMLMDLINRGKVYRFLLKPVSPGRARLAVEASVKHHLEAPDSAFKSVATSAAATRTSPPPKPAAPKPAATPAPKPEPKAEAKPEPKPEAPKKPAAEAPAPKSAESATPASESPPPSDQKIEPTLSVVGDDGLPSIEDDLSATGIIEQLDPPMEPSAEPEFSGPSLDLDGGDDGLSLFSNPKIIGVAAAAVIAVLALGAWLFMGSSDEAPVTETTATTETTPQGSVTEAEFDFTQQPQETPAAPSAIDQARAARDAGRIYSPPEDNAIHLYMSAAVTSPDDAAVADELAAVVDQAIGMAESALLNRRIDDAAEALAQVGVADPNNSRLPFLTAQLAQAQQRDYLDSARAAIRDNRLEDAAAAIDNAASLGLSDTADLDSVREELGATRSAQAVEDVLAQAAERLEQGQLIAPANDNARYYYELVLSNDPGNTTAEQGLAVVAGRLVLQARSEIDRGRLDRAATLLSDARRIDASSSDLAATSAILNDARERVAAEQRRQEEARAAAEAQAEAERVAAEQRAAAEREAAAAALGGGSANTDRDSPASGSMTDSNVTAAAEPAVDDPATSVAAALGNPVADEQSQTGDVVDAEAATIPVIDQVPVPVSSLNRTRYVAPRYPRAAERRNLSGWVDILFTVGTDGSTKDIVIRDSNPGDAFVNSAITAVERWEFEPVVENGVVVERRAGVRMMFALE